MSILYNDKYYIDIYINYYIYIIFIIISINKNEKQQTVDEGIKFLFRNTK